MASYDSSNWDLVGRTMQDRMCSSSSCRNRAVNTYKNKRLSNHVFGKPRHTHRYLCLSCSHGLRKSQVIPDCFERWGKHLFQSLDEVKHPYMKFKCIGCGFICTLNTERPEKIYAAPTDDGFYEMRLVEEKNDTNQGR